MIKFLIQVIQGSKLYLQQWHHNQELKAVRVRNTTQLMDLNYAYMQDTLKLARLCQEAMGEALLAAELAAHGTDVQLRDWTYETALKLQALTEAINDSTEKTLIMGADLDLQYHTFTEALILHSDTLQETIQDCGKHFAPPAL